MKNILLPTDLSIQSLWPVHNIVKEAAKQKLAIHVVHLLNLPSSISDLLFLKENTPYRSIPDSFIEAFQLLKNKYSSVIEKMELRFVYGNTSRFLNNFIKGNDIETVYLLTNYNYAQPLPLSVNFPSLLNKCKVEVRQLPIYREALSEYQILSALLTSNEQMETLKPFKAVKPAINNL